MCSTVVIQDVEAAFLRSCIVRRFGSDVPPLLRMSVLVVDPKVKKGYCRNVNAATARLKLGFGYNFNTGTYRNGTRISILERR